VSPAVAPAVAPRAGPYSPDPDHPWNRVHGALFLRTDAHGGEYGLEELDPLLWSGSTYLLRSPRHEEAVRALEEFFESRAEERIEDPLRRAVFQRDLWAVFDWLAEDRLVLGEEKFGAEREARTRLAALLARVIGRVALSREQIRALPDNYAAAAASGRYPAEPGELGAEGPFLPPDLFAPEGPWSCLRSDDPLLFDAPLARTHAQHFDGRSIFSVHLRLPGGRAETLDYLERLREFSAPRVEWEAPEGFIPGLAGPVLVLNPRTPQLPAGSAVALVRRMLLVDRDGDLVPSALVESVQIRLFRGFGEPPQIGEILEEDPRPFQRMVELELDRERLFRGEAGGVRAVEADERGFLIFLSHGWDPFDRPAGSEGIVGPEQLRSRRFEQCNQCHGAPGIFSMPSYTRINTGAQTHFAVPAFAPPAKLAPADLAHGDEAARHFKSRRFEWGLLLGLLAASGDPHRGG